MRAYLNDTFEGFKLFSLQVAFCSREDARQFHKLLSEGMKTIEMPTSFVKFHKSFGDFINGENFYKERNDNPDLVPEWFLNYHHQLLQEGK